MDSGEFSQEFELDFPSPIVSGAPNNDNVKLTIIVPPDQTRPIPAVLILHYWGASDLRIERSMASELTKRGIGSVIMTLPYHLSRTPPGYRSGELAIQPDPSTMRNVMLQSVLDARRAIDWMSEWPAFDKQKLGVTGTSLGAIVASLTFAVEPRLKSAGFVLGGADLAHILWNSSRVVEAREVLRKKGFTEERMREALKPIEPLNFLNRSDPRQSLVVGAVHDTVVPAVDTQKLIDALYHPHTIWLDTGHYGGAIAERRIFRSTAQFFLASLNERIFEEPKRLIAPTIRIGFQVNAAQGLQVVAGIDVWRSNTRGDFFASALLTPRGGQGFLGARVTREVSLGIVLLPKKPTVGLFWSQVF